jgi:hypothetical protein
MFSDPSGLSCPRALPKEVAHQCLPEHVTDPEHVVLPRALPVPSHSGHRLQPHKAPCSLQPAVVTGHDLTLVQHCAQPRGGVRPTEGGGQRDKADSNSVTEGGEKGGRHGEGDRAS